MTFVPLPSMVQGIPAIGEGRECASRRRAPISRWRGRRGRRRVEAFGASHPIETFEGDLQGERASGNSGSRRCRQGRSMVIAGDGDGNFFLKSLATPSLPTDRSSLGKIRQRSMPRMTRVMPITMGREGQMPTTAIDGDDDNSRPTGRARHSFY